MTDAAWSNAPRILIAEPSDLVRRGIREVLIDGLGADVVGELADPAGAAAAFFEHLPDLAIIGLAGTEGRAAGLRALEAITARRPDARLLAVVDGSAVDEIYEAAHAGARGVAVRDAPDGALQEAARAVLRGEYVLGPRLTGLLFRHLSAPDEVAPAAPGIDLRQFPLTPREGEVLGGLARGWSNKEIAAQLGLSVGTVKSYVRQICRKLHVRDRTQAAVRALSDGSLRVA